MIRRFFLLIACIGVGAVIGVLGQFATGNVWWYLAIPIAVAAGWLWVGTPEQCCPEPESIERFQHTKEKKP